MSDRALCFEIETPSERPTVQTPRHPRWERILPRPWRQARRRKRIDAAFDEWAARVQEWELAGRPPDRMRVYVPRAEVTVTELPNGDREVSAQVLPYNAESLSVYYPSQENPS